MSSRRANAVSITSGSVDMGKTPHTATFKWKRVIVKLYDGTIFNDRFVDRTDKYVMFEKRGKVMKRNIKAFIIDKGIHHEHKTEG